MTQEQNPLDWHLRFAALERRITKLEAGLQEMDRIVDPQGWIGEAFNVLESHLDQRLDRIMTQANFEEKVLQALDELKISDEQLRTEFTGLKTEFTRLEDKVNNFNERFGNYQQATQWVVQLALSLIATATVTIIISTVVRR
jgi:uncharacterized coiled-coil protein SlyX